MNLNLKRVSNINQTNSVVAEQPHNHLHTDILPGQPGQLKEKIRDIHQDKQNGSKEMDPRQTGSWFHRIYQQAE